MKKAFRKDIRRSIVKSKARFLSILAIIALSTGFFAGIKSTCPDMVLTADTYYKEQNLMDIKYISTFGFAKEDIEELQSTIEEHRGKTPINELEGAYTKDIFAHTQKGDLTVRVHSLSDNMNRPVIVEGRMPENENECVVSNNWRSIKELLDTELEFYTTDKKEKIKDTFHNTKLKVVGVVESPMYIHGDMGNTNIGDGTLDNAVYVNKEVFSSEYFTEVFATTHDSKELTAYSETYENSVEKDSESFEGDVYRTVKKRFDKKISDLKKDLEKGQKELDKAKKETLEQLEEARQELLKAEAQLEEGKLALESAEALFEKEIAKAEQELESAQNQLEEGEAQLNEAQEALDRIKELVENPPEIGGELPSEVKEAIEQTGQLDPALPGLIYKILQGEEVELTPAQEAIVKGILEQIIEEVKPELPEEIAKQIPELEEIDPELAKLIIEYLLTNSDEAKEQVDALLTEAQEELNRQKETLQAGKKELEEGRETLAAEKEKSLAQLTEARREIEEAQSQIYQGWIDYENGYQKALDTFKEKQKEIDDGKKELDKVEDPEIITFTRSTNYGYDSYYEDAQKIDAIAKVFPVFFILVAALICFTTMTRMVEEERTQIGTLKALGYSGTTIASKYLVYGVVASFTGCAIGLSIGFQLFPKIIFEAYSAMYIMPSILSPFRIDYALGCTVVALLVTSLAVLLASYKELAGTPSYLMRPKPPKSGKRILLERATFLWSRLSFTHKVTARNLFRYKGRVMLTVVGIAGCTALMLAGFGIRDSINAVVQRQFGNVWLYESNLLAKDNLSRKEQKELIEKVKAVDGVEDILASNSKNITLHKDGNEQQVEMRAVVGDKSRLGDFVVFKDRETGERYQLEDKGVILTEKAARVLSAKVGDTIEIDNGDNSKKKVTITAITENYAFHYIYMSDELYENLYKEPPSPTILLVNFEDGVKTEEEQKEVLTEILEVKNVLGGGLTTQVFGTFSDMMGSLNYIVLVLIVCAGALAIVVLYNLTNINVAERVRELATIKVLGFYDKEVTAYIYRENVICSLLGIILGLILGVILHKFVIVTAEVDMVMFGREVLPLSFLYAAILTAIFSGIVNIVLHFKLKKINMVESLKSVE